MFSVAQARKNPRIRECAMSADAVERIETLLAGCEAPFERTGDQAWTVRLGADAALQATLVCLNASAGGAGLLKVYLPVGKLPENAGVDFLKELLRKNRTLGHGGFAVAGRDTVAFVDTLQLKHCDQNELQATLAWVMKSVELFKEKLDESKLPYLDPY
jgi:hypothetical protein